MTGTKFDPGQDKQAQAAIDLVGNASNSLLYMWYDDKGTTGNATDDELALRIRVDEARDNQSRLAGYLWMGIDVDMDGDLDVFLMLEGKTGTNSLDVYSAGSGANTSPSTSSIALQVPLATLDANTFRIDHVTTLDTGGTSDVDADSKTDDYVSFKFNFSSFATIANNKNLTGTTNKISTINNGAGLTKDTPLRFVLASAQQTSALNGDIGGFSASDSSSTTYAAQGAFSSPMALGAPGVTPALPASKLVITGSSTQTAGSSQTVTITAYDSNGNVATSYTGDKSITFSGANASTSPVTSPKATDKSALAITFGTGTTMTFTNGVATSAMTLYKAETAVVSVTDGTLSTTGADRLTVNVSAASASKLTFGTQPSSTAAGASISPAVTARIEDAYGNLTNSTTNIAVAIGNNPASGTLSGTASAAASGGIATFSNLSINNAGTGYTLSASSAGLTGTTSSPFNITAATALSLSGLAANNKTYDGTTAATIGSYGTLSGVQNGDDVSLDTSGASASFANKNVGSGKTVTVTGLALSGADAGNYTIADQSATASITPITLSIAITSSPVTQDPTPTISGTSTAPAGSQVTVTINGKSYTTTVQAGGAWSVEVTDSLADGTYPVTATVADGFGNAGTTTSNLTVDTTAPTISITSPPAANTGTPTICGTAGAPNGTPIAVTVNSKTYTTTASGGAWCVTIPAEEKLPDGSYPVTATLVDAAGNSAIATQSLKVSTEGTLSVRVTTDFGEVVAGITVEIQNSQGEIVGSPVTDGSGTLVQKLPAGNYTVSLKIPAPIVSGAAVITGDKTTELSLVITSTLRINLTADPASIIGDGHSTSTLTAELRSLSGAPTGGVAVTFRTTAGSLSMGSASTNAQGIGTSVLTAPNLKGTTPQTEAVTATVFDITRGLFAKASITIRFLPATVNGVVRNARTGEPVAGAIISVAEDFDGDGKIDFEATFTTGADGRYEIVVPQGNWTYNLTIKTPIVMDGKTIYVTSNQSSQIEQLQGTGEKYDANPTISGILLMKDGANEQPKALNEVLPASVQVESSIRTADGKPVDKPVKISPEGAFQVEGVSPGTYRILFQVKAPDGTTLAGTGLTIKVSENGELALETGLIDPYGIVRDSQTGEPIEGVTMKLYWADHPDNIVRGRTPHTLVNLPELPDFQPGRNLVPQVTNKAGEFAWMVFPNGWYYIIAERDGYEIYDSRKEGRNAPAGSGEDSFIQNGLLYVGSSIVKYDLQLQPIGGTHQRYIQGYPDALFYPERSITRAEVATILTRITGPVTAKDEVELHPDVNPQHWAVRYIKAAKARGLMIGDPDGKFRPNDPISRAEFVTVVNRMLERGPLTGLPAPTFPDVHTDYWAYGQVEEAATSHRYERVPDHTERWVEAIAHPIW